jgi:hypothetical protein
MLKTQTLPRTTGRSTTDDVDKRIDLSRIVYRSTADDVP